MTTSCSLLDNVGYSSSLIRFWRVQSHREGLEVLAEATTHSGEADYLSFEWSLIRDGNHAEFELRRGWALSPRSEQDPTGWRYVDDPPPLWLPAEQRWKGTVPWIRITHVFGPPHDRHLACLCNWLHGKPYPSTVSGGGGAGDAGGRARRIIADLDQAEHAAPRGLSNYDLEKWMSTRLGWHPPAEAA